MDHSAARVIGAVYLAITQGLSDEGTALANDVLYRIADASPAADAHILRSIANSSVNAVEANYEQQPEFRRMSLRIVDDGAA